MTLTSKPLAVLLVIILFGGIFFSSTMGWWQTESTKETAKFTSGEFTGQADPADIRGSYTFGDVEKNFGISPAVLADAFGVKSDNPAAFAVKELEGLYAGSEQEIGTASVRLFVAFYKGLPNDLSTDIYLPEAAATLLHARNLSNEQAVYLASHTMPNPSAAPQAIQTPFDQPLPVATLPATSLATPHATDSTARLVKGSTTFADLLGWGVSKETIETVLGVSMPAAPETKVKDYCTEKGLTFETVKIALQAEVDKVK
jgi:hypothetical protein